MKTSKLFLRQTGNAHHFFFATALKADETWPWPKQHDEAIC